MNCEVAHERIVTAAYGELGDEQAHELERLMGGCPECVKDREQLLALKLLMDAHPAAEPEANLVARARMRLEEALDALPPWRWYERLGQRIMNGFASLQAAPHPRRRPERKFASRLIVLRLRCRSAFWSYPRSTTRPRTSSAWCAASRSSTAAPTAG